jgi:hypothetical protein
MTNKEKESRCICGKICKNWKGLRVHMGRMKCAQKVVNQDTTVIETSTEERSEDNSGKTQEILDQEANHSAQSLLPGEKPGRPVVCEEKRVKVKWPKSNETSQWERLDDDLDKILGPDS